MIYQINQKKYLTMEFSNCCDAPILAGDICSKCKEHCTPIDDEEGVIEGDQIVYSKRDIGDYADELYEREKERRLGI